MGDWFIHSTTIQILKKAPKQHPKDTHLKTLGPKTVEMADGFILERGECRVAKTRKATKYLRVLLLARGSVLMRSRIPTVNFTFVSFTEAGGGKVVVERGCSVVMT